MLIKKHDVNVSDSSVLVIGLNHKGQFFGETMLPVHVGYPACFANSKKEWVIKLNPGPKQVDKLIAALNDGVLKISDLEQIEGTRGGKAQLELRYRNALH